MRASTTIDDLAAHRALVALPEVWEDLVHGRVSADEAAAAMAGSEPDDVVERSLVLFAPPSAAQEQQTLDALLAAHVRVPPKRVVPRWLLASVTALAASLLVYVMLPKPAPRFDGGYALELSAGYLDERDQPASAQPVPRYREGQRISLRLRPSDTLDAAVGVEVFAVADGVGTKLSVEPEINEYGVVSIAGSTEALGLSVGQWQLVVVVGLREHLPHALAQVQRDDEAPYDVLTAELEIVPNPPLP